jgi:hypothetical protein
MAGSFGDGAIESARNQWSLIDPNPPVSNGSFAAAGVSSADALIALTGERRTDH